MSLRHAVAPEPGISDTAAEPWETIFVASAAPMWLEDQETGQILAANDAAVERGRCSRAHFLGLTQGALWRLLAAESVGTDAAAEIQTKRRAIEFHGRPAFCVTLVEPDAEPAAESAALYRNLFEVACNGYWEMDAKGRFTHLSPAYEKSSGITVSEWLGKRLNEIPGVEIPLDMALAALAAMKARLPFRDFIYSLRVTPESKRKWIRVNFVPFFGANGDYRGYRGVSFDATSKIEAELAVQESERNLRVLLESVADYYWESDRKYRVTYLSSAYDEVLGLPRGDLIGKRLSEDANVSIDPVRGKTQLAAQAAKQTFRDFVYSQTMADGRKRWLSISGAPIFDENGVFQGYRGVGAEITRHVEAEQAMRIAEQQLQEAVVHVTQPIVLYDADDRIVGFNQAFTDLHRVPDVMPPVYRHATFDYLAEWQLRHGFYAEGPDGAAIDLATLSQRHRAEGEHTYHLRGGRWMLAANRLLPGGGKVGLWTDITALKRTEEALRQSQAAAEQANQAKSVFLAHMSHEIRTPMNGIIGMNTLLLDTPLTREQREYSISVRDSAEALLTVINDILDISKLEAGKIELESIDFDLVDLVENAASLLAPKAREKRLDLAVLVDPAARRRYRGDPTRIRQVLLNLVGNAVKFTERGGIAVEVTVEQAAPPVLRFVVSDTGIGMSETTVGGLFQKFSQADSSITRQYGGTGLGLAICKELVELMGGRIAVASRLGAGSTLSFVLPLTLATSGAPRPVPAGLPAGLKGRRALVVHGLDMTRSLRMRLLAGFGMRAAGAVDAVSAMAELERAAGRGQAYDLAVLDDLAQGQALAERIRATPGLGQTKLLLATSAGEAGAVEAPSVDDIIAKPLRHQALCDRLTALFERGAVPAPPPAMPPGVAPAARPLRILLAEDNRVNQRLAAALLQRSGHSCTVAQNGREAVEAVAAGNYDLVLMDVEMPEMGGIEATLLIRAMAPPKCRIAIIAMTAHAMSNARETYLAAGMDDYISKPISPAGLLAKLAAFAAGLPAQAAPIGDDQVAAAATPT
jgi:PAS domain S-box-containing protein